MPGIAANNLADRFAWLIDGLCRAIGTRVRLLGARFIALAAQVRAGRLAAPRAVRRDTSPRPSPRSGERDEKPRAVSALPRDFGRIRRVLPETTQYAGVLSYLLRDPKVAALVDKAPQAQRILRPLCHLLGVRPPEFLRRGAGRDAPSPEPEVPPAAEAPPLAELPPQSPPSPAPAPVHATPATPPRPPPGGLAWDGRRWIWL